MYGYDIFYHIVYDAEWMKCISQIRHTQRDDVKPFTVCMKPYFINIFQHTNYFFQVMTRLSLSPDCCPKRRQHLIKRVLAIDYQNTNFIHICFVCVVCKLLARCFPNACGSGGIQSLDCTQDIAIQHPRLALEHKMPQRSAGRSISESGLPRSRREVTRHDRRGSAHEFSRQLFTSLHARTRRV